MRVNLPFLLVPAVAARASVAFRNGATSMRRLAETNSKEGGCISNRVVVEALGVARATSTPIDHNRFLRTNMRFKILQASMRHPSRRRARCHRFLPSIRATHWSR